MPDVRPGVQSDHPPDLTTQHLPLPPLCPGRGLPGGARLHAVHVLPPHLGDGLQVPLLHSSPETPALLCHKDQIKLFTRVISSLSLWLYDIKVPVTEFAQALVSICDLISALEWRSLAVGGAARTATANFSSQQRRETAVTGCASDTGTPTQSALVSASRKCRLGPG